MLRIQSGRSSHGLVTRQLYCWLLASSYRGYWFGLKASKSNTDLFFSFVFPLKFSIEMYQTRLIGSRALRSRRRARHTRLIDVGHNVLCVMLHTKQRSHAVPRCVHGHSKSIEIKLSKHSKSKNHYLSSIFSCLPA